MFKRLIPVGLAAVLLFTGSRGVAAGIEPPNIYTAKQEIRAYVSSGDYFKRIAEVALQANKYLVKRIARGAKDGKKLAIVFDIDETTLSNLSHIVAQDFGFIPPAWDAWVVSARCPAIVPVQTIYDTAVRGQVEVFFITGRTEEQRASTERNLRDVGYESWTKVFFKPTDDPDLTTRGFKIDTRRKLQQQGYVIIANIGDQDSDLVGGYAERFFKLPNPFYLTK